MQLTRDVFANEIVTRLRKDAAALREQWTSSAPINRFVVDQLLPEEWVLAIRSALPPESGMMLKKSLRELKYVTAQMDRYDPLLEESIYAFQRADIVSCVESTQG